MDAQKLLDLSGDGDVVDSATLESIQQFLFKEARLLDGERHREWYDLLAEDLFYWVPLRENRFRRDRRPEISPKSCAMFDETKDTIDLRLQRLETGMAWTEDPATRHVYAVSNIEAFKTEDMNLFEVHSVFILYRNSSERDDSTLMGRRKDILRKTNNGFEIVGRLVLLQQATLLAKNLSVFF